MGRTGLRSALIVHSLVRLREEHQQLYQHRPQGGLAFPLLGLVDRVCLVVIQMTSLRAVEEQLLNVLPRQHQVREVEGRHGCLCGERFVVEYECCGFWVDDDVAVVCCVNMGVVQCWDVVVYERPG